MSISLYTKAGQDRTSNESRQAYIERLIQHDRIKRLGSGGNATVFVDPENPHIAVRVAPTTDGGFVWLNACLNEFKNNPWVPRVIDITRIKPKGLEYYVAFTEILKPAKLRDLENSALRPLVEGPAYTLPIIRNTFSRISAKVGDPNLTKVFDWLLPHFAILDVGEVSNFMLRGRQLVINDPLG